MIDADCGFAAVISLVLVLLLLLLLLIDPLLSLLLLKNYDELVRSYQSLLAVAVNQSIIIVVDRWLLLLPLIHHAHVVGLLIDPLLLLLINPLFLIVMPLIWNYEYQCRRSRRCRRLVLLISSSLSVVPATPRKE